MKKRSKRKSLATRKFLALAGLILLAALGGILYLVLHHTNSMNLASGGQYTAKGSTSKPTSHQVTPTSNNGSNEGGVVDKNGQTTGNLPPAAQWVSSSSGNITLQQPSPNAVVRSGDSLSGLAKVSNVQFILSDSSVGLIAQGNLNVVNGKFDGILQFTPHSNSGKLEVYYPNPNNGAEEDIIEINVSFST